MDAIALLKADHDKVKRLLDELESTTERGVKTRTELFATIKGELTVHEIIEEEIFYPELKAHPKAKDIVLEGYEEHHVVDLLMGELEALDVEDETWGAKAKVMKENIEHHIEEEEGEMFQTGPPGLRRAELDDLGRAHGGAEGVRQARAEHPVAKEGLLMAGTTTTTGSHLVDPREAYPRPPFPEQRQQPPGSDLVLDPAPDHGEATYEGRGRLAGYATIVTGADSGIGKAVALAFAREGADVVVSYLQEDEDAANTLGIVQDAGRRAIPFEGDLRDEATCRRLIRLRARGAGRDRRARQQRGVPATARADRGHPDRGMECDARGEPVVDVLALPGGRCR